MSGCKNQTLALYKFSRINVLSKFPFPFNFPGMFRRITAAGSRLLKAEGGEGGSFYTLEGLNSLVLQLITTHPSLVLLWCQVLLIINYTNYTWWSEVHQTPRSDYVLAA